MSEQPHSADAEASVVGQMLASPKVCPVVIGTGLTPEDFHLAPYRILYDRIVEAHYADDPIDPLVIGEAVAKRLARTLNCDEPMAVKKVQALASGQRQFAGKAIDHAQIVRRHASYRGLLDVASTIQRSVGLEEDEPEAIAALASQEAMKIATGSLLSDEILSFEDAGRNFVRNLRRRIDAKALGVELGAKFGYGFIDRYTNGLQPGELMIVAGEPGAGKSAVVWRAAQGFAERQLQHPGDRRIGALVLSLEMGEEPSSARLAQSMTGIDSGRMRAGDIDGRDLQRIVNEWKQRRDLPLYLNHTSTMRASQMRAVISEAVRRHNVGVVVIDHFRYWNLDKRLRDPNQEDEEKTKFLKSMAHDLNVAIICIAHTVKSIDSADGRPTKKHLRGSGQSVADADFLAFVHRPYTHASQADIEAGRVLRTDAEWIWSKNRFGLEEAVEFYMEFSSMRIEED